MQYFSYGLSLVSVISLWLMGNKSIKQYGLLLGVFAYTIVHIRNLMKWAKENKQPERIN